MRRSDLLGGLSYLGALSLLSLGIFLGATGVWMVTASSDKPLIVGTILSSIASFAAAGVALWVATQAWKKESDREKKTQYEKTELVVTCLRPRLTLLYLAILDFVKAKTELQSVYWDGDKSSEAALRKRPFMASFKRAGVKLYKTMDYDNFSFLGRDLDRCFEIDPTVGIAIVNLKQRIDSLKVIYHIRFMSEASHGAAFVRTIEYFNEENEHFDDTAVRLIQLLYINEGQNFSDWYRDIHLLENGLIELELRTKSNAEI